MRLESERSIDGMFEHHDAHDHTLATQHHAPAKDKVAIKVGPASGLLQALLFLAFHVLPGYLLGQGLESVSCLTVHAS